MSTFTAQAAAAKLRREHGLTRRISERVVQIAYEFDCNGEQFGNDFVTVRCLGGDPPLFEIADGLPPIQGSHSAGKEYTSRTTKGRSPAGSKTTRNSLAYQTKSRKEDIMAPRGKAAAAAAEPEVDEAEVEEERDYSVYAEKELTPKMLDFAEWVGENVGDITEMEPERLIALGPTLYHDFQRSDFNKSRTEERRAARVTAAEEKATAKAAKEEPEAAPAKPAGRGRAAGRATPAKAAATRPAAATPPKRRGRPAASAAKEAAY